MEPIITFENFTFKYRTQSKPTLKNINLTINKGEKILITGSSGSGKSTIAKCINGLIPCSYSGKTEGKVTVAGLSPEKEGIFGMSKHVGTVLQDTDGQFIGLTVAEDIAFALENDAVDSKEMHQKVLEAAEMVDVTSLLKNVPGALSGGQKQRVSLAGILVDDVDILLFDEPLANLDPASGKRIIALIDELNQKYNKTIIIIEHRVEDVLYKKVDRIVVVDGGTIVADDVPSKILSSSVLIEKGIREPLYIAALKHAGCSLDAGNGIESIDTLDVSSYRDKVRNWFKGVGLKDRINKNECVLELRDVSFSYPNSLVKAVDKVSFRINKGEMVSIVGTNGAGKSTIASLICGFNKQDSGSIFLDGKDISSLSIKERGEHIGFVMQNQNQMISKPMISEETGLGLAVRKVNKSIIKEKVNEALKICGMYPFRNWPVSAVSFGQKKRVTIASILVLDPEIIILDEPTAGQDYEHYTEIMEFLKKLNEERGITIVMITHDMHLMLEYTDRAIVVSGGKVIADDRSSVILTDNDITQKASLKRTSLYDLSLKCGIEEPSAFVDSFIYYERVLKDKKITDGEER